MFRSVSMDFACILMVLLCIGGGILVMAGFICMYPVTMVAGVYSIILSFAVPLLSHEMHTPGR
jgi:hypothetical protein